MTHEERNRLVLEEIKKQTFERLSGTPEEAKAKCRAHLISLGIYNENGELTPEFGGK